jgi:phosphodiesterase/alkaline phosphatase D-like protein
MRREYRGIDLEGLDPNTQYHTNFKTKNGKDWNDCKTTEPRKHIIDQLYEHNMVRKREYRADMKTTDGVSISVA